MAKKLKDDLLPFQRRLADDPSRYVVGLWSRQTGKGYTSSFIATHDAATNAGHNWIIAAPTERQAMETLSKCKAWARKANILAADTEEELVALEGGTKIKAKAIEFPNGSRIYGLPGRPSSLRGFTGSLILDDFAFFEDQQEVWKAVYAVIVNPMANVKRVLVTSTPAGTGDMFHRICDENLLNPKKGRRIKWSVHKVTIHEAAKEWEKSGKLGGQTAEEYVADIRAGFDTPEAWPQEFECEFLDGDNNLLSLDMIRAAESVEATTSSEWFATPGEYYLGIDFGRTSDPTVAWAYRKVGDVLLTVEVLVLKHMSTTRQMEVLRPRLKACARACLDYTGPGIGLGDMASGEFGRYNPAGHEFGKVELCTFSAPFKRLVFPRFRQRFESPVTVRIPYAEDIRADFHAMRQIASAGNFNYWAPRTSEGHSDRCTAAALGVRAADFGGEYVAPFVCGRPNNPDTRSI